MSENNEIQKPNGAQPGTQPGKGYAIASLVCGIVSLVLFMFGVFAIVAIVGIVLACLAKKNGFVGGIRTAGFVTSIIGLSLGALYIVYYAIIFIEIFDGSFWYFWYYLRRFYY